MSGGGNRVAKNHPGSGSWFWRTAKCESVAGSGGGKERLRADFGARTN